MVRAVMNKFWVFILVCFVGFNTFTATGNRRKMIERQLFKFIFRYKRAKKQQLLLNKNRWEEAKPRFTWSKDLFFDDFEHPADTGRDR